MEILLQNHSSYPAAQTTEFGATATERNVVEEILRAQEQSGIDVVTDGQIHWSDPVSHIAGALDGVRLGTWLPYFDTACPFRQPVIIAAVQRRHPILLQAFIDAGAVSRLPVKPVLTGPYTLARLSLIKSGPYADVAGLAHAFSDILAVEVRELAQAGARYIQVDEPAILAHPRDIRLLRQLLEPLWSARNTAAMVLASYFAPAEPLYAQLNSLPADILALDCVSDAKLGDLIAATGASKVLALGVIDGRDPRLEDASTVARQVEKMLKRYLLDSVHLLPSCGLQHLPRDRARAKLALLGRVRQLLCL